MSRCLRPLSWSLCAQARRTALEYAEKVRSQFLSLRQPGRSRLFSARGSAASAFIGLLNTRPPTDEKSGRRLEFTLGPANGSGTERVTSQDVDLGMVAGAAPEGSALETVGSGRNIDRCHSPVALRAVRPTDWENLGKLRSRHGKTRLGQQTHLDGDCCCTVPDSIHIFLGCTNAAHARRGINLELRKCGAARRQPG